MEDIQTQLDQCKLLLDRAEVGLWEADFVQRSYICSDYLMSIFGKKGNKISLRKNAFEYCGDFGIV